MKETIIYDSEEEKEPITEEGLVRLGFSVCKRHKHIYYLHVSDKHCNEIEYNSKTNLIDVKDANEQVAMPNCKTIQDVKVLISLLK